ncbi:MAG: hypothetical protein ABIT71_13410 [Vicinamibacteraceae bacterium]
MRLVLPLVLLALLTACTAQARGAPPPPVGGGGTPPALIGAWRASVQVSSGAFAAAKGMEFMYVFHIDRTLTESSNYDAAPPVPPAYGMWRMIEGAGNVFEAKYEFFSTTVSLPDHFTAGAGRVPSGRGVFTERITVAPDGRTFSSIIRHELFDTQGRRIDGGGEAVGRGVRMGF